MFKVYTLVYLKFTLYIYCACENVLILKIWRITKHVDISLVKLYVRFDKWDKNDHDIMTWTPNEEQSL